MPFWPKPGVPKNKESRECSWSYLIGQYPFSPVFGQKRPGAPLLSTFAQLLPDLSHNMFPFDGLLKQTNTNHKNYYAHVTLRLTNNLHSHQPGPRARPTRLIGNIVHNRISGNIVHIGTIEE